MIDKKLITYWIQRARMFRLLVFVYFMYDAVPLWCGYNKYTTIAEPRPLSTQPQPGQRQHRFRYYPPTSENRAEVEKVIGTSGNVPTGRLKWPTFCSWLSLKHIVNLRFLASLHHRHQRTTFRTCFVFNRFDNKLVKNIFCSVSCFFFSSFFFFKKKKTRSTSLNCDRPPHRGKTYRRFEAVSCTHSEFFSFAINLSPDGVSGILILLLSL
jgi:hypothetical protein